MLDFERWFQRQGRATPAPSAAPKEELPDGLWRNATGKLVYTCRACENTREWDMDPTEFDNDMAYCGGSPRCIP